ncbi:hypothetical protein [Polyangium aurulentum]|uniref:hypothetical protein n=1 Tax=Polyangium aurulentum TaxID=2567896 RepID=UPI0010AE8FC0|nr:hypothetical protein [Polyangium aurulentum]UQA57058.1 hypothetical protein E8A73_038075 [Polyangium aurulentum]
MKNPVRVAVVQLAYHPAFKGTLEDPLVGDDTSGSSLLPSGAQAAPAALRAKYNTLKRRVRDAYVNQLGRRLEAILEACRDHHVQVLVFPEYAVPPELLERVAKGAGDMLVVAGSHWVDRETLEQGIYAKLGMALDEARQDELLEQSVSPVLHRGALLSLIPKLHPAKPELGAMKPGTDWAPVTLPAPLPSPLAVLICLDFLTRHSEEHHRLVAEPLRDCRFIAAPALTKAHSRPEFAAEGHKDSHRRGSKPVLFANLARHGGSTIFVDEGRPVDESLFPEHAGRLEAGEEGVIIADVDLGVEPVRESRQYEADLVIKPVAAASFVYRSAEPAYTRWLDDVRTKLADTSLGKNKKLSTVETFVRENLPPLPTFSSARKRRLERLLQDVDSRELTLDFVDKCTTEIVLPGDVLPLDMLRAALARGAADEIASWANEHGEFGAVRDRLRAHWDKLASASKASSVEFWKIASDVRRQVGGGPVQGDPRTLAQIVDVYEAEVARDFEAENQEAAALFKQERFAEARKRYQTLLERAETLLRKEEIATRPTLRTWAAQCRLGVALSDLNLQEHEAAREELFAIDPADLPMKGRIHLAEAFALIGEHARGTQVLPSEKDVEEENRARFEEATQTLAIMSGHIPSELRPTAPLLLRTAAAHLDQDDLEASARRALEALGKSEGHTLTQALALPLLAEALRRTVFELRANARPIPEGILRKEIIDALTSGFDALRHAQLPARARKALGIAEAMFCVVTKDPDGLAALSLDDDGRDEFDTAPHMRAQDLAREGRIEEALRALPHDTHPWRGRLRRVEFFTYAKQPERALEEALALSTEVPDRAPIEHVIADLLWGQGRVEEALPRAQRAFGLLPGLGYRLLLAKLRLANGDAEDAWALVHDCGGDERLRVVHTRALIATRLGRLADAEAAWLRYTTKQPRDGHARVTYAQVLAALRKYEAAADLAWSTLEEHGDTLTLAALHTCGTLQRLAGPLNAEQTRRIRAVADRIKQRFHGNAEAEHIRLSLLSQLGEIPEGAEIDWDRLVDAGRVIRGEGISSLEEQIRKRRNLLEAVSGLAQQGAIPVTTAATIGGVRPALLVTRLLEQSQSRPSAHYLCPPVSLVNELPALRLDGARLLVSMLELVLLEALELAPALREALGSSGRIVLFERTRDGILADAAKLRVEASPKALEQTEKLLRRLEHMRVHDPDKGEAVLLEAVDGDAASDAVQRISPRAFVRQLAEQHVLDEGQRAHIEKFLSPEPESGLALPNPLPPRIVVSWAFVENLFEVGALDAVFVVHRDKLLLAPDVLPYFRLKRDGLADGIRAAALADRILAHLHDGWFEVIPEPEVAGLPPLRELGAVHEQLVLSPLRAMMAYRIAALEQPELWRLSAEFFGSRGLGNPELLKVLAWADRNQYISLVQKLRQAAVRDLTLPALVRILVRGTADAERRLRQLALLGFPDALEPADIINLEKQYTGLDGGVPERHLAAMEWMARTPWHLGGDVARLRLAQTYAGTITQAFAAPECPAPRQDTLLDVLLRRQESIGEATVTPALELTFRFLAGHAMERWRSAWQLEEETARLDPGSGIAKMWRSLREFTGKDPARCAALGRALRHAWTMVSQYEGGPPQGVAAALVLAHPNALETPDELSLLTPADEAVAILSALWKEGLWFMPEDERLLAYGVELMQVEASHGLNPREAQLRVNVDGHSTLARVPIEALFLRLSAVEKARIAPLLKRVQGPSDGDRLPGP